MTIWNLKLCLLIAVALALAVFSVAPVAAEQGDEPTVMISQDPGPDPVPAAVLGETNPPHVRTEPRPGEGTVTQSETVENLTGHGGVAALRGGARPVA